MIGPAEIHTNKRPGEPAASATAAELVLALRAMGRALQVFLVAQARATGLPLLEFLLLTRAADDDGITARDGGQALRVNTSTMTGLTDRLEQDKLIRRRPHPTDRRSLLLKATPRGRKAVQRTLEPLLAELTELVQALQVEQRQILDSFIKEVTELMLKHANAARPRPTRRAITRAAAAR